MTTWNIGRRSPTYTPAPCRFCGTLCRSAQGRLAHERHCLDRPAAEEAPAMPEPPRTASQALAALARGETPAPYHCPQCGGSDRPESLRRPGMCKHCSKRLDARPVIVPETPEEIAVAARIARGQRTQGPERFRGGPGYAPARAAATERAALLLGDTAGARPLDAWLVANATLTIADQARKLDVSATRIRRWRQALIAAGQLEAPPPAPIAADRHVCPGCGGAKQPKSERCQACRRQEPAAQQRQSYAAQAAGPPRARPHLPGGPPLSVEAERVYALWQAARARGDEYEQALYVRQYLVARARDWGVVRPAKRKDA